jgi:hypothetical protein
MSRECLDVQDLDRLAQTEAAREHARSCPRCGELLSSYEQFVEAREIEGAQVGTAEAELDRFLHGLPDRPARRRRRWVRPTSWIAAVAAMAAVLLLWPRGERIPEGPVLREEAAAPFTLLAAERGDEGWRLRWNPLEGADAYEVRLYSTSLEELRRIGPMTATHTLLPFPDEGVTWLWRVVALRGGDVIGQTDVGTLTR